MERNINPFVGYEYKEIITDKSKASLLMDGYENFGWEVEDCSIIEVSPNPTQQDKMLLRLKRNRKIMNKMELTRLQRNFDACVAEIEMLERQKSSTAIVASLVVGILGALFITGAVFAFISSNIILGVLLSVPGALGCLVPYFLYKKIQEEQSEKLNPLIEQKFNEIYEICEKGNRLLH